MALLLPGTSAVSHLTSADDIVFSTATRLSISGFIKWNGVGANKTIYTKRLSAEGNNFPIHFRVVGWSGDPLDGVEVGFTIGGDGGVVHYNFDTNTGPIRTDLDPVVADEWLPVGIRIDYSDLSTVDIFTNGTKFTIEADPNGFAPLIANPAANPRFGGSNNANTNFAGTLARFAVWNRLLSDAEFALLHGVTEPGVYASPMREGLKEGLLGSYRMNESESPSVDASGNENALTWAGTISAADDPVGIEEDPEPEDEEAPTLTGITIDDATEISPGVFRMDEGHEEDTEITVRGNSLDNAAVQFVAAFDSQHPITEHSSEDYDDQTGDWSIEIPNRLPSMPMGLQIIVEDAAENQTVGTITLLGNAPWSTSGRRRTIYMSGNLRAKDQRYQLSAREACETIEDA